MMAMACRRIDRLSGRAVPCGKGSSYVRSRKYNDKTGFAFQVGASIVAGTVHLSDKKRNPWHIVACCGATMRQASKRNIFVAADLASPHAEGAKKAAVAAAAAPTPRTASNPRRSAAVRTCSPHLRQQGTVVKAEER